jgi:hypothetical protein
MLEMFWRKNLMDAMKVVKRHGVNAVEIMFWGSRILKIFNTRVSSRHLKGHLVILQVLHVWIWNVHQTWKSMPV